MVPSRHRLPCETTGPTSVAQRALSEPGRDAGLLADFVGRDSIELPVAFDRDHPDAVGVDGVVCTLPEEMEAIFFQMTSEITSLDGHVGPLRAVAR